MLHHGKVFKLKTSEMLSIFIFGDLQFRRNDDAFDRNGWEQFKDEFKSTPNAWAIGLGDYEDFLRQSNFEIWAKNRRFKIIRQCFRCWMQLYVFYRGFGLWSKNPIGNQSGGIIRVKTLL